MSLGLQNAKAQSITKVTAGAAATPGTDIQWTAQSGTVLSAIQASDGVNIVATGLKKNAISRFVQATNWGYTVGGSGGFPPGATIVGIKVEIKRNRQGNNKVVDGLNLKLLYNGAVVGNTRSRAKVVWNKTSGYVTYGGISDTWSAGLTAAQIATSGFGVQVAAKGANTKAAIALIDHIRITVYYNLKVYYSKNGANLSLPSSWVTNPLGTSGTSPNNFTDDSQLFILTNQAAATLTAPLTISGANSKMVVGDVSNSINKTTFTIPSGFAFTGVIDCISKDGTTANSSDVVVTNAIAPSFGTLDEGTTVTYNGTGSQAVAQAIYDNLTLSTSGSTKTVAATGSGISAGGVLTVNTGVTLALNGQTLSNSADINGTASSLVNNGTISGGTIYLFGDAKSLVGGTGTIANLEVDNDSYTTIGAVTATISTNQTITGSLTLTSGTLSASTLIIGSGATIYRDAGVLGTVTTFTATNPYDVFYSSSFQDDGTTVNNTATELTGTGLRNVTIDVPAGETLTNGSNRTLTGNLTVNTGTLALGTTTINLAGNYSNNSTVTSSGTFNFNGSSATTQTVGGTGAINFSNVTVNATGLGGVTLLKDITVSTALQLTAGKIFTGANTLIYSQPSGAVTRGTGYVVGILRKTVLTTLPLTRTFEVGTTNYTPVQISFTTVNAAGTLDATVAAGDHPSIGSSTIDASKTVNTYWTLSKPAASTLAFGTYGLTFNYTNGDNDNTANAGTYVLAKLDGGSWAQPNSAPTTSTSTQLVSVTTFNSISNSTQFQIGVPGTQPVVSSQPTNQSTCNGAATSFSATASGGFISSAVWQISTNGGSSYTNLTISAPYSVTNPTLPSANNAAVTSTLNISNSTVLTGNLYRAVFTNGNGSTNSNGGLLTANANPSITTAPIAQVTCIDNPATFNVVAAGGNLSYQWRKAGSNISGATSSSYTISNAVAGDAANYDVVITNTCSSFTSAPVALTVNALPSITTQPVGQTVCSGNPSSFTVVAAGAGLSYQWQKDNTPLVDGVNGVSGATSATLTINPTPVAAAGIYEVVVNGTCIPSVTSNDVVLIVDEGAVITSQPAGQTVCAGTSNVQFSVTASGASLTYQWKKDGVNLTNGVNGVSGATGAILTLATAAAVNAGSYTVLIATANCTSGISSNAAVLTVTAQVTPSVSIAITSGVNPTCSGSSVTFTATPTNGGTPFYQWKKAGSNVGTNSATYTDPGTAAGSITCVMTTSLTCVTSTIATSNAIALNITAQLTPSVSIAITSGVNPTCSGSSVTFTATPTNGGTPSYQWKKGGTDVGTNSATYTDPGTAGGSITVVMTTSLTCVTSTTATSNAIALSVTAQATPSVSIAISSGVNPTCSGSSVTFTATPTNGGTPSYQWKKDGSNVGTNSATYTDGGTAAGSITCVMTTSLTCVTTTTATSNAIGLSVTAQSTPSVSISITSGVNPTCSGYSVTFTATPTNGGTPSYQWKKDGSNVGTNSATYTDGGTVAGSITCVMTTSLSCVTTTTATSNAIALAVTAKVTPSVTLAASPSNNICPGSTITFTATPTNGGGSPSYDFKVNGISVQNGSGNTYTSSSLASGDVVSCVLTTSLTCVTSSTANGNDITMVTGTGYTWTGGTSTSWNVASNWTACGVPPSGANVIITNGTFQPSLVGDVIVGDVALQQNAKLSIGSHHFTVNGAITGTGTFVGSAASNLSLVGTVSQALNFDATGRALHNLVLNHSATTTITLTSAIDIYGVVSWANANSTLDFADNLVTLKSTAAETAAIGEIKGALSNATNVTVERYIPATARAWRMLSFPVTGTQTVRDAWANGRTPIANAAAALSEPGTYGTLITGHGYMNAATANAAGFDWIDIPNASSSVRKFRPIQTDWPNNPVGTPPINSIVLSAADQAYLVFVRGDRTKAIVGGAPNPATLRTHGTLKIGQQSVSVSSTNLFTVVGNPYASPIDFDKVYTRNATAIKPEFKIWNADLGANGGYVTIAKTGGVWSATPALPGDITYIQSGQGLLVSPNTGGALSIEESDKVTSGNLPAIFDAPLGLGKLNATLFFDNQAAGLKTIDGVMAAFKSDYTPGLDPDDVKKAANFNENVSLLRNNNLFTIEARPLITQTDTLFLQLAKTTNRKYALQFKPAQMQDGIAAYLEDAYTGKETAISLLNNELTTYSFDVSTDPGANAVDRFMIVFKTGSLPLTLTSAKAYQLGAGVQVEWKTVNERGLENYEVEKSADGNHFTKATKVGAQNSNAASYAWLDASPVKGQNFYRIKAINKDGSVSYSQVLLVNLAGNKGGFVFYPNPAKSRTLSILLSNLEKGTYTLAVFNNIGQQVMERQIDHTGGSAAQTLDFDKNMAAGIYRAELVDSNGKRHQQTLIFQ